ncbi:MAG: radical SAM protein [archaeon]
MSMQRFLINLQYAVNFRKPQLMMRLASNMLQVVLLRKDLLRHIDINVGPACNLKCQHCFASNFKKDEPLLTNAEWTKVADECNELGSVVFQLTGGEPLAYKSLDGIIKSLRPQKNLITIATNGTLVTEKRLKELKKIGVDVMVFSLDSGNPEEHDEFRNAKGTYDRVMKSIEMCQKLKMKVSITTTLTHKNIRSKDMFKLFDYAIKRRLMVSIALLVPAGRALEHDEFAITEEDSEYLDKVLVPKYPNLRRDWETNYWKTGCGAATEKLYIAPYGDVMTCPYIHLSFGNAKKDSIKTIQKRMMKVPEFRKYPKICLAAEDKGFQEKYMYPTFDSPTTPIMFSEVDNAKKKR